MRIALDKCIVRSWQHTDAESMAKHANNRKIWLNLRDAFPSPYNLEDAEKFIAIALAKIPETFFCIEVDAQAVGSVGYSLGSDVERISAEIGYWLSEDYWGRGIMTETLKAVTRYAITTHDLTRVYATPYEWNKASCRVLEKAGYHLEGRLRKSVLKNGVIADKFLYAFIIDDE
ncbi:GNAT family N-acetyltransferase [candidate division KSB1 bacterium]|nr:GNAT family N-acetyltransferase [candidate division KSB1 bacterium]